jgi:hypothetical protein
MTTDQNSNPEINFETFILSVGTAAMMALGEIENPMTKKKEVDLESAKQNIRILEVLAEKTKGNLDDREQKMMQGISYEIKMKFVEKTATKG